MGILAFIEAPIGQLSLGRRWHGWRRCCLGSRFGRNNDRRGHCQHRDRAVRRPGELRMSNTDAEMDAFWIFLFVGRSFLGEIEGMEE